MNIYDHKILYVYILLSHVEYIGYNISQSISCQGANGRVYWASRTMVKAYWANYECVFFMTLTNMCLLGAQF